MKNILPLSVFAAFLATPALAHHPLGGETPTTALHGFLSGVGHPMLGLDHFAFVVGVGVAAAVALRQRMVFAPLAFIVATLVGCLMVTNSLALPFASQAELIISASVVAVGAMLVSGKAISSAYLVLFAVAGLYHGSAYGGAIIGAEQTPLLAYLAGFGLIQYAVAMVAAMITAFAWKAVSTMPAPRLAGAAIFGVGFTFCFEILEPAIIEMIMSASV